VLGKRRKKLRKRGSKQGGKQCASKAAPPQHGKNWLRKEKKEDGKKRLSVNLERVVAENAPMRGGIGIHLSHMRRGLSTTPAAAKQENLGLPKKRKN